MKKRILPFLLAVCVLITLIGGAYFFNANDTGSMRQESPLNRFTENIRASSQVNGESSATSSSESINTAENSVNPERVIKKDDALPTAVDSPERLEFEVTPQGGILSYAQRSAQQ